MGDWSGIDDGLMMRFEHAQWIGYCKSQRGNVV